MGFLRNTHKHKHLIQASSTNPHNTSSSSESELKTRSLQETKKTEIKPTLKSSNDFINTKQSHANVTAKKSDSPKYDDDAQFENNIDQELSDILSMPSITLTNDEYFKWAMNQSSSFLTASPSTVAIASNYKNTHNINRTETMTTTHTLSSMHNIAGIEDRDDRNAADEEEDRKQTQANIFKNRTPDISRNSVSSLSFSHQTLLTNTNDTEVKENNPLNSHKTSLFEMSCDSHRASMDSINMSKFNNST